MSKDYRGALYYLMTETAQLNGNKVIPIAQNAIDDLEELVKRNEPMTVAMGMIDYIGRFSFEPVCPICGQRLTMYETEKYCPNCGQKLDWRDKNDKSK